MSKPAQTASTDQHLRYLSDDPTTAECVGIVEPLTVQIMAQEARLRLARRAWLDGGCKGPQPQPQPIKRRRPRNVTTTAANVSAGFMGFSSGGYERDRTL